MKKTFFTKIFFSFSLILFILLLFFFNISKKYYIENLNINIQNLAYSISQSINSDLKNNNPKNIQSFIDILGKNIQPRITVLDIKGNVIADTDKDSSLMENHINRFEIQQAIKGIIGKTIRYSSTLNKKMLYIAVPVMQNNNIAGITRIALPIDGINILFGNLKRKILYISFIILIFSLAAAAFFSRQLALPLKKITYAVKQIAKGNMDYKILLNRKDEFHELAFNLNNMAEKIKELFSKIYLKKEELDSILSSMQEGLVVIDKKNNIIMANKSFKNIIKEKKILEKPYWAVIRNTDLDEGILKTQKEKTNVVKNINFRKKQYMCSLTYLKNQEKIILMFHDITKIKNLKKIKKDFIANASHELRTPLTLIKGYIETLMEETADKKNLKYLEIINKHSNRLISMVKDIMILSETEEKNVFKTETINLIEILESTITMFSKQIKEKNIQTKLITKGNALCIEADYFSIGQIFINLLDNAVKYTDKGTITITAKEKDKFAEIIIEDTGIGIANEHLNRIFERFYTVDKSRSRESGGTGLGLSIVKHIILLHKGSIQVSSTPNKGTKFTLNLPKNLS